MDSRRGRRRRVLGDTSKGVRLMQLGCCYFGFGWNTGEDCRNWSHICGSWYLPMLRLRGVLYMDKHGFIYSPGLTVDFFMHYPQTPPIEAYITATELAAAKLPTQEAEEFRSDVNRLLKQQQPQQHKHCNLTTAQCRALTQLKKDSNRVVLTTDKGVTMVVMDLQDYNNKAQTLLQDTNTYKVLPKDPTPPTQKQTHHPPQNIHQTGGLSTHKYQ